MQLLPPSKDRCQCCAVAHLPSEPHNAQSLYYQVWFESQHKRVPTWADAMAHCPEDVQQKWMKQFTQIGVDIYSTNLIGDIKSKQELSDRLSSQNHD